MQKLSLIDNLIVSFDQTIKSYGRENRKANRDNPANKTPESLLSNTEKQHVISLMRINHTGEVCAQALYKGQALTARNKQITKKLKQAAEEESDHLLWCEQRLQELGGRTSFLNPFWYVGSLTLGIVAGFSGDHWNLGFLAETENQVSQHLSAHLSHIPKHDSKTKIILETMRADEMQHATTALNNGAYPLPNSIKKLMRFTAKLMTSTVYYI